MKILFIQTGGTIDKDYPRSIKGYAFEIAEPAVGRIFENILTGFEYRILPLLQKDSMDLTAEDIAKIRECCANCEEDKIIITHGTDTMINTATALAGIPNKTIILTGAMRPQRFSNSDADFNLGVAIGAMNLASAGIYIAMNGMIHTYDKVKRDLSSAKFIGI